MIDSIAYSERIRELCLRYYMPPKNLHDGGLNPKHHPSMCSEAVSAASCMVSISRVFKMLETLEPAFIVSAVIDLSFGIAENQFWKQHNTVLVPSFKNALHAYFSSIGLRGDKAKSVEKDSIAEVQSKQWHSIFLIVYDCLYGMSETIIVSPAFLQELVKVV